jgi:hypothetical protein
MTPRNTIRPVTLKRVIETCSIATKTRNFDTAIISKELSVSSDRAKEIILELELMGLLTNSQKEYFPTNNTKEFLEYFENEHWNKIHEYFNANYRFYHDYIKILQSNITGKGLTLIEIKDNSIEEKLSLNQTAVEVLSDWCERLGVTQRHLFTRRIYLSKNCNNKETSKIFKEILLEYYREFSNSNHRRGIFMEIPTLREDICEKLSISRKSFDEMLRNLFLENIGKIELSGAPITTLAKKSPLSEKKMVIHGKDAILSPKFEAAKEREGLIVGQKAYYYIAIHEAI